MLYGDLGRVPLSIGINPYLMNVDLAIFGKVSLLMVQNQCCFPD